MAFLTTVPQPGQKYNCCKVNANVSHFLRAQDDAITVALSTPYKYGFKDSGIRSRPFPPGLNTSTVEAISEKNEEPNWLRDFRINAFRSWQKMTSPEWAYIDYEKMDYNSMSFFAEPEVETHGDRIDPAVASTLERLGVHMNAPTPAPGPAPTPAPTPSHDESQASAPAHSAAPVAVDAVFDSVSVGTTYQKELQDLGVLFCPISQAVKEYPDLVRKYLASVVPVRDNFFACLNSAVFSDGTFLYLPRGVQCPMEVSTYFRINTQDVGQFERTLIVAEEGSSVSYLEGCTAPAFDTRQLHAAVVELVCLGDASIKYSTVQNWYSGDSRGRGGIHNFVTKRGMCLGPRSRISWTQLETGSAVTWKYPSCVLVGEGSVGEFYSVALTNNYQQADTGTKMIHVGPNTRSRIVSKGISAGSSINTYRGAVTMLPSAKNAKNNSVCDSLMLSPKSQANTFPVISVRTSSGVVEHEASTSRLSEDQLLYMKQRGLDPERACSLLVSGFCRDVLLELPLEFAAEADQLLGVKLENTIG
eukprot:Rmarinus@m.766